MYDGFTDEELDEVLPVQQKPKKSKNYRERIISKEQEDWRNKPKARLKTVSDRKRPEYQAYAKEAKSWLRGKTCALCGTNNNLSVHHKAGRGKLLRVKKYWVALCLTSDYTKTKFPDSNHSHSGGCHGWVEANHKQAEELGLIIKPEKT